jgi:hypothetical protein
MDSIPEIIVSNFPKQIKLYKLNINNYEATSSQYLSDLRSTGSLVVIYDKTLPNPKYEFGYVSFHNAIDDDEDIVVSLKTKNNIKYSISYVNSNLTNNVSITKNRTNISPASIDIFVPIDSNNLYFPLNLRMMKYLNLVTKTEQMKAFADATSVASSRGVLPNLPKEIKQQEISSFLGGKRRTRRTRRRSKSRKNH